MIDNFKNNEYEEKIIKQSIKNSGFNFETTISKQYQIDVTLKINIFRLSYKYQIIN